MAESRASAVWQGDLGSGNGKVSVASGAFPEQAVTWAARTNRPDPKTSPEELIAAAHAACYAMAFSNTLATAGHVAERLAKEGEQGCPVSNALRGNVEIGLAVTLES